MFYKEFTESAEGRLEPVYGKQEGRAIALRLLQHFCGISSYEHIINPLGQISEGNLIVLYKALDELVTARPLQYVLGFEEFYGRKFFVEEGVLIPRPETEELVKWIREDKFSNSSERQITNSLGTRALDAACGSGCIGITLAFEIADSEVFAMDISDKAIEVTHRNIAEQSRNLKELRSDKKICFSVFKGDLLADPLSQNIIDKHSLDIIVSNPPYVRECERVHMQKNVLDFEPAEALFVPDNDPLKFYKALVMWGITLLKPGGSIYLEINESCGRDVVELFESSGYSDVVIRKDLSGKDRMVRGILHYGLPLRDFDICHSN